MSQKRLKWNEVPEHNMSETNVQAWNPVEVGRCGTDSILSIGYGLRHREEIEAWADEYGFSVAWR